VTVEVEDVDLAEYGKPGGEGRLFMMMRDPMQLEEGA